MAQALHCQFSAFSAASAVKKRLTAEHAEEFAEPAERLRAIKPGHSFPVDRAVYYGIVGYEQAGDAAPKDDLRRVQDLAVAIGLMSERNPTSEMLEE